MKKNIQMRTNCLLGCEMIDECSSHADSTVSLGSAAYTSAADFDGREVFRVGGVFEADDSFGGDSISKPLFT